MLNRVLFTLVLLCTANIALADNFEDALTAYKAQNYSIALEKFIGLAQADCSQCPPLDEFLRVAREDNPGVTDEALTKYWSDHYGPALHATIARAQFFLGVMYDLGQGVPMDLQQAIRWYTKAAEVGHTTAQLNLGVMYANGQGVLRDYQQAVHWYTKAAGEGHAGAQLNLGVMYANGQGVPQDYQQAVHWYAKAAEAGYAKAQFNLGVLYTNGQGVPQNYQQAMHWFRKAAEKGDAPAQFNLGVMYDQGQGVPQDYQQAIRWYTKAAEAGHTSAQLNLGLMYANGDGIPQDYVQAHKWFNLAASHATDKEQKQRAVEIRDRAARKMSPQQVAEAQKLAREWQARTSTLSDRQQDMDLNGSVASGTGFLVSRQGHILTNHHVIEGCRSVHTTVEGRKKQVTVTGKDAENDLAVLQLPPPIPNVARFREGRTIRPGDGVVVIGFPLPGLLASEAQVTTGTVSALAGIGNNTRFLQITAPVQPGNSGGPLLDQSGNIVGVVVSKLNALTVAKSTGDIPQNINFAINGAVVKAFLDSQGVEYETAASSGIMGPADIGAEARKFTLLLECNL
jgi:TPR repeat protein